MLIWVRLVNSKLSANVRGT